MKLKFTLSALAFALAISFTFAQGSKTPAEGFNRLQTLYPSKYFSSDEAKQIEGTLTTNGYEAGETVNISFTLNLTNEDFEYADSVAITFPSGFTINSVSNNDVFGPSFDDPMGTDGDPEPFNGIDGQTVSWGDNDNTYGGITPGAAYTFSVNVTVDAGISGVQTGDFYVSGDGFGPDPGDLAGTFTMEEGQTLTIFNIVENSEVHETLEAALVASGLNGVTSNPDADLTLFAPTDDAFNALPAGVVDDLLADPTGALANVLLYHVVPGTNLSTSLMDGMEVLTAQGESVSVSINGDVISINDAEVTIADIETVNGVVHVIDAVLIPSSCTFFAGGPYGAFNAAFDGVPVAEGGVCPFNVITDFQVYASEAYVADNALEGTTYTFGISGGDFGAWDPAFVIISAETGEVVASETEGSSITWTAPADGNYLWIIQEEGFCGGQSENLGTDNGFPYMTCESSVSITDIVVSSDVHETLEAAVIAAGLDGTLDTGGPFTVFAPTDEAFDALPAGVLEELLADPNGALTQVLQHHVVSGVAYSTDLSDGQVIPTLLGDNVTVGIDGEVTITSSSGNVATVTITDIIASNGVVHVIDAVLVPEILSVENLENVESFNVYPNPTNNQFTVDIDLSSAEEVTIDMINVVGQVVKSVDLGMRSNGLNREFVDVNNLPQGLYFMNITVGDSQGTIRVQVTR